MLRISNISKKYQTGDLVQRALDNVSLNLRDNEFVAVLGPSGSGKTTLLNIIGGLDRYDTGDLIINGISTKQYTDRDWDSYRNHSIGFVFQSYNLIPHQTILSNVELALTISGVSAGERSRRAKEALGKVGLGDQIHKKPSQLSGGQMQRVAIARALVNNPDILLADEPTGALDSETSIHIMDLLKEVAKDKLVVMVTHNPELAEQYSTRIVELKDGRIISDSDPLEASVGEEVIHQNMGRSSMSYLTSLLLSFNNLWTKKARTILVSIAGSIGIIGIAMILALSTGANQYIHDVQEDSLKDYPLEINDSSMSLTSMYASGLSSLDVSSADNGEVREWSAITNFLSGVTSNDLKSLKAYFESDECDIYDYVQDLEYSYGVSPRIYQVNEKGYRQVNPSTAFESLGISSTNVTSSMFSSFSNGDTFYPMPSDQSMFEKNYEIKAGKWPENYDECVITLTSNGMISDLTLYMLGLKDSKELDEMVSAFAEGKEYTQESSSATYHYDDFLGIEFCLVSVPSLYTYDKNYNVWTDHSSDKQYMNNLLEKAEKLKIVGVAQPNDDNSNTTSTIGIGYTDQLIKHVIEVASKTDIVKAQLANKNIDVFTGKPFEDDSKGSSDMNMASLFSVDSDAIGNIFNLDGESFDLSGLDLNSLDFSDIDLGSALSEDDFSGLMPQLSEEDIKILLSGIKLNLTAENMKELFGEMLTGFEKYIADDPRADMSALPSSLMKYFETDEATEIIRTHFRQIIDAHAEEMFTVDDIKAIVESYFLGYAEYLSAHGYPLDDYTHIREYMNSDEAKKILQDGLDSLREKMKDFSPTDEEINSLFTDLISGYETYADSHDLPSARYLLDCFINYLGTDEAQQQITKAVGEIVDTSGLNESISKYSEIISAQMGAVITQIFSSVATQITSALESGMGALMTGLSENLMNAFNFDSGSLADMFKTEMTAEELKDLMVSLFSDQKYSYESNLKKLGYADLDSPTSISIYPIDFESKEHIKDLISSYNERMKAAGEDDKIIEYTDLVDALMSSVTVIIDAISYVLIAFVAISLVVSSIMIGVITYISVLERKKEIGILRALGASKRNISQVFNAETFIIGALAGVIGIAITYLLIIPTNAIIHLLLPDQNVSAILPFGAAIILVILSIILTLIGGFIPSKKAAKKDPVIALRTE